jgi:hypothetical protein
MSTRVKDAREPKNAATAAHTATAWLRGGLSASFVIALEPSEERFDLGLAGIALLPDQALDGHLLTLREAPGFHQAEQ